MLALNGPHLNKKVMGSDPLEARSLHVSVTKAAEEWWKSDSTNTPEEVNSEINPKKNAHQCSKTWASASLMCSFYLRFMLDVNNKEIVIKKIHLQV